ncbi:hypothetical protein [Tropicimonas marinistellae]|uniref:hypothetical protein n=1 Tax=Tropicimonas marinistellae TaxID=1739787 RepID=UPI00082F3743|nr:hypothetical protein [Tropicimonas marinistellae]
MKRLAFVSLVAAAGCAAPPDVPVGVTSRAPNTTFACIAPRLERLPVRFRTEPTAEGWRMDVEVFSGPPAGWYRKGTIEHSGHVVLYAPDGATLGIASEQVHDELVPIIRRCSGR